VAEIHQAAAIQMERIQAIVDGAVLAVDQVQDKRIDILAQGPEVEISDVIFDMLLGVCFKGVGKALVPITQSIASESAQAAAWYCRLAKSRPKFQGLRFVARLASAEFAAKWGYGTKSEDATLTARTMADYNEALRGVLEPAIGAKLETGVNWVVGKLETAAKGESSSLTRSVDLEPTDTPGVAVLGAAQTYASTQRAAIAMYHAGFEAIARASPDPDTIAQIREAIALSELGDEIVEIRDRHKMLFEAVIWAKLFGFDGSTEIKTAAWPFKRGLVLPGVTPPLLRYWRRRFARVIEQWLNSLFSKYPTGRYAMQQGEGIDLRLFGFREGDAGIAPGAFAKANRVTQEDTVVRFFVALSKDLERLASEGIGEGGIQIITPPVAKSK
jgi:hypothetical protein